MTEILIGSRGVLPVEFFVDDAELAAGEAGNCVRLSEYAGAVVFFQGSL